MIGTTRSAQSQRETTTERSSERPRRSTDDLAYRAGAHIFNLPKVVRVRAGGSGQGPLIALTEISYDEGDLLAIPGAVARDESYTKGNPLYDPWTFSRGLPTTIRRYADPAAHDTTTTQEEHRQYDEAGNLVRLLGSASAN